MTYLAEDIAIGANATIVCGISVGRYVIVGVGTVVLWDVPATFADVDDLARDVSFSAGVPIQVGIRHFEECC